MKNIVIILFLFIFGIGLSCIYFLNSDINPNIISYNHSVNNIVQDKGGIRGEFIAANNYLGVLTLRFDNKDVVEKKSDFKIKEKQSSTWYHTSSIDAVSFSMKPLYTFGLPTITDSKNKMYQFEILLPEFVPGDPALILSNQQPILSSQYVIPWKVLLKNQHLLFDFLKQKISYQLQSQYAPWVFLAYFLPLIGYLLYIRIFYKYISYTFIIKPITLIALLGMSIDIFILRNNYTIVAFIFSFIWINGIFFHKIKPQTSILAALFLLIWCPFFLIAHMEWVAEKAANWMFILTVIGFIQYFLISMRHYEK